MQTTYPDGYAAERNLAYGKTGNADGQYVGAACTDQDLQIPGQSRRKKTAFTFTRKGCFNNIIPFTYYAVRITPRPQAISCTAP